MRRWLGRPPQRSQPMGRGELTALVTYEPFLMTSECTVRGIIEKDDTTCESLSQCSGKVGRGAAVRRESLGGGRQRQQRQQKMGRPQSFSILYKGQQGRRRSRGHLRAAKRATKSSASSSSCVSAAAAGAATRLAGTRCLGAATLPATRSMPIWSSTCTHVGSGVGGGEGWEGRHACRQSNERQNAVQLPCPCGQGGRS